MDDGDDVIDLLVIGGGTAGIVGSKTAAGLGARTILVERARTGGDCLWTGCIPSKTLLSAAAQAAASERALTGSEVDFSAIRARIAGAIAAIEPDDSPESLESAGVTVLPGSGHFTAVNEANIDGKKIRFRQALIATGSEPAVPGIPGLDAARVVTSESVWDLTELPGRLVIIGGGPVGCELGQAFARLGSEVVIMEEAEILPQEDREAAALVRTSLETDGVRVVENTGADHVSATASASRVHALDGQSFDADVILVATGRKARTDGLGLEAAGVQCDESGRIVVDATMRTTNPAIWAAGDATPYPDFTHLAGVHASTAASNAVLGLRRTVKNTMPRVTFTSPELAAVGITVASARGHTTSTIRHAHSDRAVTERQTRGMTRIVIDRRGTILGGTIVGPRAGESLAELSLAVQQKLTTRELAGLTHAYPTYNDALWNAAITHARSRLASPLVGAAVKILVRINRWRTTRRSPRGDLLAPKPDALKTDPVRR